MLAGICGGLGQFFGIDSSIVRLIWVLLTVASGGLGVIIYLLLIFVLPEEPGELTA
ncbi:MAG: PspC domain-containing protein [Calditrichaeota bacterium]|nr:MAG: PspC domain-containing protein [Calditrichota bacterium]